jgi:peptidyl-prolyl cis-trans isomerase SurA
MIKKFVLILLLVAILPVNAQSKKDKVLLTIENQPIYSSEFLRVYNKNKDVVSEENKKDMNEYLELFINYKLKLQDARDLKLDTVKSYLAEFNKYKAQLTEPFLKDREVTDKLVKEAYDRTTKEVKASHILVMVKPNALPKDTLKAYNKVLEARTQISNGKKFNEVAKKFSEDPSAKENGGDLGYFAAFSMVYPFETAAYNTPEGEVSMPFRTRFGYHIVKVFDVRDSKGEIKVAHIMIRDKKKDKEFAKKQISDIYNKYKQGEKFELLAKKYSDDKASAAKGGVIRKFSQGKMIQPFADISFNLKNIGDVSEPFETKFGWHIVKLIERFPVKSFDEMKDNLTKKVEKGERSVLIGKSIAAKLKKKYKYTFNNEIYQRAFSLKDNKPNATNKDDDDKIILFIENHNYKVSDLKKYLKKNSRKTYKDFIDDKIIDYYKDNLEFEDKEFAATLQEYRDGLLLFDLLQNKIWTKAEKDTIGLQNFFDKNASKYQWKKRVKADLASCTKEKNAKLVLKYMKQGKTVEEIKNLVNDGATVNVLFHSGTYEIDSNKLPKNFGVNKGASIYKEDDKHFTVINVSEILESAPKELNDVKGKVISNYQDYLEKQWIKDLRAKYKIEVNKKVFKKLVKKNS